MDDDLITATEACELTGRGRSVIGSWQRTGALPVAGRRKSRSGLVVDAFRRADVLRLHAERPKGHVPSEDPTEEELDRMIAEGLANLPSWWAFEGRKAARLNVAAEVRRALGKNL